MRRSPATVGLCHPGWVAGTAAVALVASYVLAVQDPIPGWELDLTTTVNDVPDVAATVLYPVMQLGTVAAPVAAGVGLWVWRRDWLLALVTVATGLATWFLAKGVKQLVERGRPRQYLPDVHVREGDGSGLGYISGHSAVAAATAVMVAAAVPPRWRPLPAAIAGLVGIGRIVHGVHLPADVVGGWAFGTLIGLGAITALERWRGAPA